LRTRFTNGFRFSFFFGVPSFSEISQKARAAKIDAEKRADDATQAADDLNQKLLQAQRDTARLSNEAKLAREQQEYVLLAL